MNDPITQLFGSLFALAVIAVLLTLAITWILFPVMAISRLTKIERNTRRLADRLDSANVEVNNPLH